MMIRTVGALRSTAVKTISRRPSALKCPRRRSVRWSMPWMTKTRPSSALSLRVSDTSAASFCGSGMVLLARNGLMESIGAGSLCGIGDATHQGIHTHAGSEGEVWPAGDLLADECMLDQPALTDSRRSSDHDRAAGLAQPALKRTHFLLAAHELGLGCLEGKVILLLFLLGLVLLGSSRDIHHRKRSDEVLGAVLQTLDLEEAHAHRHHEGVVGPRGDEELGLGARSLDDLAQLIQCATVRSAIRLDQNKDATCLPKAAERFSALSEDTGLGRIATEGDGGIDRWRNSASTSGLLRACLPMARTQRPSRMAASMRFMTTPQERWRF